MPDKKKPRATSSKGRTSRSSGKRGKRGERGKQSPKPRSPSAKSVDEEEQPNPQKLLTQIRQLESTVKELQEENNMWYDKYHNLENAFNLLTRNYGELKETIYVNGDVYKFNTDSKPIEDIDHNLTERILRDICHIAKHPPSLETRMEEMETRITKQNSEVAYLLANTLLYESVLNDIYHTRDVDYIHDKIADTFIQTGDPYQKLGSSFKCADDLGCHLKGKTAKDTPLLPTITVNEMPPPQIEKPPSPPSTFQRLQQRVQEIRLIPPIRRMAGTTHIQHMNLDLKMYICRDLNMERRSHADWRMLAKRVGIPSETIDQWRHMKLVSPMNRVLAIWGQSENASMRMLHRHLTSPEMNAILLAKRIEDFYDV